MYKTRMEERSSVTVHLSQAYAEQLRRDKEQREKNRAALESIIDVIESIIDVIESIIDVIESIIDVIRFLARQNISFRGHR